MTWGQIRQFVKQHLPELDLPFVDALIRSVYHAILEERPWVGREGEATLVTTAPYTTGTADVTNGSAAVTGSGTSWAEEMVGRKIRFAAELEYYTVLAVSGVTDLTLDRPFLGDTAAGASYSIWEDTYSILGSAALSMVLPRSGRTSKINPVDLFSRDPARSVCGVPAIWTPFIDSEEEIPPARVLLWPIPDGQYQIQYTYLRIVETFDGRNTGASPLPFVSGAAIVQGVLALAQESPRVKNYAGAQAAQQAFERALAGMRVADCARRCPVDLGPRRQATITTDNFDSE